MNDTRLLLLVIGPNLALWGALFGGASRPPGSGVQAMASEPAVEPLAMLPAPAAISPITPPRPPAVLPVHRPRQLRVFQPPAPPLPSRPTVREAVKPVSTPVVVSAPPPAQVPLPASPEAEPAATLATDHPPDPDVATPAAVSPSTLDLQEAVVRARALLPESLDAPSPLP